jgi:predicted Fe-S protein YdhL (DUF1289 family)
MTERTVLSPCIGVCVIDVDSGYCTGCWRTLGEIAAWPEYGDARRLEVLEAVKKRAARAAQRS